MKTLSLTAGITFVLAWVAGLALAGSGPAPDAGAQAVAAHFDAHAGTAVAAHLLVDGIAGAALIALAIALHRLLGDQKLGTVALASGIGAGIASLFQLAVAEAMTLTAARGGDPDTVRALFTTLNNADTVKIALIAALITTAAAAARSAARLPRWLTNASLAFAPLLAVSGLSFPLESGALYAVLYLTLPLLLVWVMTISVVIGRRIEAVPSAAPPPTAA